MIKIKSLLKELNSNAVKISEQTNKSKFLLKLDMLYCLLRYLASPNNYEEFEFYNLTAAQRKTYVTYGISRKMIKSFNNPKDIYVFEDKFAFADTFKDLYGRKYLNASSMSYNEFLSFCQGQDKFICKPADGSQGAGITVYHINKNEKELFDEIKSKYSNNYILEEWIKQHPTLSNIYPNAVNCLRIITVYNGKETKFLTGGVTFGISTEIANGSQPSIIAPVDFKTGILNKPAATFGSKLYENHPTTNAKILGVQLPYWKEIIEMLNTAAAKVPTVGYIGWDIAITPTGPIIIEGNTTPGYKYYQIPSHLNDGIGNRAIYENALIN